MPYITSIERMAREEGRAEERQKLQAERRLELIDQLYQVLQHRFGTDAHSFRHHIDLADIEQLKTWFNHAFTAPDLVTLFGES